MHQEKLHRLSFDTNQYLALWEIYTDQSDSNKNIFLAHGTFSNRKVLMGISSYLAEQGYHCWILEWRGHGNSDASALPFDFETIAEVDYKIAFEFLRQEKNIQQLSCITHSGGGICLTIFLIKNPSFKKYIQSIVFFGCQAFGANTSLKNAILLRAGKYLSALLGFTPARFTGSPQNEKYFMMKQWFNWNLDYSFKGKAGIDYLPSMKNINTPILSISAEGDPFVAPKSGCQKFLDAFQNPDNQLIHFSKQNGNLENYNHSRILHSQSAKKEVYPLVLDWLQQAH